MQWVIQLQLAMRFVAILVTAIASNPYLPIVIAALIVFFLGFRWYYLKTARDVKRLEAVGASAIRSVCDCEQGLDASTTGPSEH